MIRTDGCLEAISVEMVDFMTRTDQRVQTETEILEMVNQSVQSFDSALKVIPFGSVAYGFGGTKTDFNILVDTREYFFVQSEFDGVIRINFIEKIKNSCNNRQITEVNGPSNSIIRKIPWHFKYSEAFRFFGQDQYKSCFETATEVDA